MKASLQQKLTDVRARHQTLSELMAAPDAAADVSQFTKLAREYAELEPVVHAFSAWQDAQQQVEDTRTLAEDPHEDPELRELAAQDMRAALDQMQSHAAELEALLMPRDPEDDAPAWLEIRAGTGGDEAALFAGDLLRMYLLYAEQQGWQAEMLSANVGEVGGYREVICRIEGKGVYGRLKFESGTHRVQRVPVTESSGRIHTSAATIAVLPEPRQVDSIDIAREDLRIDTYRASGAGGQHVNKTDSAVRITHLPTGVVVECQDERSQHKNRSRAMSLLQARLTDMARQEEARQRAQTRRDLVGSGDRSQRIRTYNFPQGRLTDHRIDLTLYSLPRIMEGDLAALTDALAREHQADMLAAL